ncbi:MAG: hypothetical protein IPP90_04155 [Gemmatimonadaceae bacterium]|nr:hypothetical protein [Gemmatimonadaceae bacterium]
MTRPAHVAACALVTLTISATLSQGLSAQVRVNPTGVSVNAMNATTVFLTFGGVSANLRPAEAFWCGELVSAAPDRGSRCSPSTIFGRLPARYDLARRSGQNAFTDIMSIPASVSRRAYQDARRGAVATFFYVRRFESLVGGADEFVAVTCRLTGGEAKVPFALTDVRVSFDGGDQVQFLRAGDTPPPFAARITHNGTGRLVGRWEVVMPGEETPSTDDLLTEASLPLEQRTQQRRFSPVQRFNLFAPPGGTIVLPGPDPKRLPTSAEGSYLVLLRIEASDDREGDSDLGATGGGSGIVHSAAVAGFPMPVLRYVVMGDGAPIARDGATRLALLEPADGGAARADSSFRLRWSAEPRANAYRVDLQSVSGTPVLSALVPRGTTLYEAPTLVWQRANSGRLRWRVTALDGVGRAIRQSGWRGVVTGVKSGDVRPDVESLHP